MGSFRELRCSIAELWISFRPDNRRDGHARAADRCWVAISPRRATDLSHSIHGPCRRNPTISRTGFGQILLSRKSNSDSPRNRAAQQCRRTACTPAIPRDRCYPGNGSDPFSAAFPRPRDAQLQGPTRLACWCGRLASRVLLAIGIGWSDRSHGCQATADYRRLAAPDRNDALDQVCDGARLDRSNGGSDFRFSSVQAHPGFTTLVGAPPT